MCIGRAFFNQALHISVSVLYHYVLIYGLKYQNRNGVRTQKKGKTNKW